MRSHFYIALLAAHVARADLEAFSVRADAPVPPFIERGAVASAFCQNCTFSPIGGGSGLPSYDAPVFASSSSIVVRVADYASGDLLSAVPISDASVVPAIDLLWDAGAGSVTLAWSDLTRLRTPREIEVVLRALRFSTTSRDPTRKGTSFSRAVNVHAADASGLVVGWPELFVSVPVVGENDAPACTLLNADGSRAAPPPASFYERSGERARLFAAATALRLSDVDDDFASAAEVFFAAPVGAVRFRAAADAPASWAAAGEPDRSEERPVGKEGETRGWRRP